MRTIRSYHHRAFPAEWVATARRASISVCLPAKECAPTIAPIVDALVDLRERGVVDQVLVVDVGSADGTAAIAAAHGAEVVDENALLPQFGRVRGKGDAMWRALSVLRGDIVAFLDADTVDFAAHFCTGVIGPLVADPDVQYVKGFFRRPFRVGDTVVPDAGGRVTELAARPLLTRFYPELAGVRQPLAGEMAGRRSLLEALPFATGYAVETALLLDAYAAVGPAGLAQVDLDVRQNTHQPLADLGPMAYAVLLAVTQRLEREGRLAPSAPAPFPVARDGHAEQLDLDIVERPPMASLRIAA
jgi:glucosyl-3-phosphoglycerate synthase